MSYWQGKQDIEIDSISCVNSMYLKAPFLLRCGNWRDWEVVWKTLLESLGSNEPLCRYTVGVYRNSVETASPVLRPGHVTMLNIQGTVNDACRQHPKYAIELYVHGTVQ